MIAAKLQLVVRILGLVLLLSGCVVTPDSKQSLPVLSVAEREARLKAFNAWRVNGSISLNSAEEGKFNASFSWDASGTSFDLKLFGPLGVRALQLTQTPEGASLIDRDGQTNAPSAEQLLLRATGFIVPISEMQIWAVGLPGNGKELQRDEAGRLTSMVVDEGEIEWNITYPRYSVVDNIDLPRFVNIDSEGIQIKLSFRRWIRSNQPVSDRLSIPGATT